MNKIYTTMLPIGALAISVLTLQASAANPFAKWQQPSVRQHLAAPSAKAPEVTTILEEDFSKFSDGTEDTPGAEIEYVDRYHIPDDMTSMAGWTGGGIFPAGGTIALMDRVGLDKLGFISTPPQDLGGTATLTFRARTLPGHTGGSLWIAVCDPDYGPGDDQEDFTLTDSWETYTMVATNGALGYLNYFQITAENGYVQIDDIKIDFKRDRLLAPYANKAINISPTEFKATWESTGAPAYRLNVISKAEPTDVVKGVIAEGFDGINVNSDGKTIDSANPSYPEGWEIDLSSNGSADVSTQEGNYNSAPLALLFDAEGDIITSPETPEPINGLKFWVKPTSMEDNEDILSLLRIELFHSLTQKWDPIAQLPYYWMTEKGGFYEIPAESLGDDVTRVRMSMIQRGDIDFIVDDVNISYSTGPVVSMLVDNLDLTETEYTVSGINPENEYSYYVQAVDGDLVSDKSYVIWVDGIVGLKPETLDATDITADSFTANWKKLGHATSYKVETNCIINAETDMPGAVVLEEDFSGITSEGMDWVSPYNFAENGMAKTGWCATQPTWKPGMAGTQGTSWIGAAGLVFSPRLNLSCNEGNGFDVEATVVTTVESMDFGDGNVYPEGVFVMVLNSHTDTQSLAYAEINTPTVGSHTAKVHVPNPDNVDLSDIIVAFMNKTGTTFNVDDVRITQDLKAGEQLMAPHSIVFSDNTSAKIDNIRTGSDYAYTVTASTRHEYEDYVSLPSDPVVVKGIPNAVQRVEGAAEGISVATGEGTLSVTAPSSAEILVVSTDGSIKANTKGSVSLHVAPGIYIVKAADLTRKVIVK